MKKQGTTSHVTRRQSREMLKARQEAGEDLKNDVYVSRIILGEMLLWQ